MKDDFIRRQYDHEVDRQDKVVSSLSLPVGILTALGTAGYAMIQGFSYSMSDVTAAFYALTGANIIAFAVALFHLRRAMFGQTYEYLPRLFELRKYHDGLVAYYAGQGHTVEEAQASADSEFEEYLAGKMIKAGTKNAINNDEKSKGRYYANWCVFIVLIITALMVVPYAVDKRYAKPDVPAVHVDNLDSILREIQNGRNANDNAGDSANTAAASREADAPGEPSGQRGNGSDGARPTDRAGDGAQVVPDERPAPQAPMQNPPSRPVPPENTEVRSPRPEAVERR